jgi:hypothetical protein
MSDQALKFVERAERYSRDRTRLRGDGESVSRYVLECAERVSMLDDRVFRSVDRESCMARIWDAYQAVSDYLDSGAPYNLDSPELPWSEYSDSLGELASDVDYDGCPEQVLVDNQYEGWD